MKNKHYRTIIATFVLLVSASLSPLLVPQAVSAVSPGCYTGGGSADRPSYTPATCPTEGAARAVSEFDACFLVISSSSVAERDCDDFTKDGNKVPDSTSTSTSADDEFESEFKGDCEGDDLGEDCAIIDILVTAINILSAVAVMAIIFSIMFAGFQYMTARDNAGQIQQARTRIIWALTALLVFIFSYSILNFLVPGGVL